MIWKRQRIFLPPWQKDNPWLLFDANKNEMFCSICKRFPAISKDSKNAFITGCSSFRLQTITSHASSEVHLRCVEAERAEDCPERRPMDRVIRQLNVRQQLEKLIRTAYYVAMTELPFSKFQSLCELQALNGVVLGNTYQNDIACKNFIESIAEIMKQDLSVDLNNSNVLSFMCDGSTDSRMLYLITKNQCYK